MEPGWQRTEVEPVGLRTEVKLEGRPRRRDGEMEHSRYLINIYRCQLWECGWGFPPCWLTHLVRLLWGLGSRPMVGLFLFTSGADSCISASLRALHLWWALVFTPCKAWEVAGWALEQERGWRRPHQWGMGTSSSPAPTP